MRERYWVLDWVSMYTYSVIRFHVHSILEHVIQKHKGTY